MKDKEGRTPIHYALLYSSSLDLLSLLLNGGKGNFHVDDKNDGSKQALLKKRMTFINSLTTRFYYLY
jgi:ankyrin repeat protein